MNRGFFLPKTALIILFSAFLSACGGGGGGTTSGSGDDGPVTDPQIVLTLVRENSEGNEETVSSIDPSRPATVVANVSNVDGEVIVTFSTTLGQLNPAAGTALTSGGVARITLEAGTVAGAGSVQAEITVNNQDFESNVVAFEVLEFNEIEENLQIGTCSGTDPLDCSTGSFNAGVISIVLDTVEGEPTTGIASQGNAAISFVVMDVGDGTGTPSPVSGVSVTIESRCSNLGFATITQEQSDASGIVRASYQAEAGCEGQDNITATIASTEAEALDSIFVFPPRVGNIIFDDVTDSLGESIETIFIQGSGRESTARVVFQVVDRFGAPKPDQDVTFSLTSTIGGISLRNQSRTTDNDGLAVAFVDAGFIATSVQVEATVQIDTDNDGVTDSEVDAQSNTLSINTGVADQNSFSISADNLSVEGETLDGSESQITVRLSDAFNNPVPDGTTVQFRTEYGRVTPSCNTANGDCTVVWNSQEPRRPDDPNQITRTVNNTACPKHLVVDEDVAVSGSDGDFEYLSGIVYRVENQFHARLIEDTDFTQDSDGSGITCLAGSTECVDGAQLRVSYYRVFLDEDATGDTTHSLSNPGIGTAPYVAKTGVPCSAPARPPSVLAPAYFGGLGQIYGGRSTVLAFAQGEESFTDVNANGRYDFGEPFIDLPEAFMDTNEDQVFGNGDPATSDARDLDNRECYGPSAPLSASNPATLNDCYQTGGDEDIFIDFNSNGRFDAGNGIYNGTLCPKGVSDLADDPDVDYSCRHAAGAGETECTADLQYCTRELVNIRRSITILSAGTTPYLAVKDANNGEYISALSFSGDPAPGFYQATTSVETNSGIVYPAGTSFRVGFDDFQVAPGIGETTSLTYGGSAVVVEISDKFNGLLPTTSGVYTITSEACEITNQPTVQSPDSNAFGPHTISVALAIPATANTGSGPVTISARTDGDINETSFECILSD